VTAPRFGGRGRSWPDKIGTGADDVDAIGSSAVKNTAGAGVGTDDVLATDSSAARDTAGAGADDAVATDFAIAQELAASVAALEASSNNAEPVAIQQQQKYMCVL